MKFSIITCTYNRLEKLKININSVINQKYQNYEHFIIDDGSDDNTEAYIKNLNDRNIIYLKLNTNSGQPTAMFESKVFNKINGDLIFILDSDDYLFSNSLNQITNDFKKYQDLKPWTIAYAFSNYKEQKKVRAKSYYKEELSRNILQDNHPLNDTGKGFVDHLFVQTKEYCDNFNKYFDSPSKWYSSRIELAIKKDFLEIYTNKHLYYMSFDNDSVSRGANLEKYAKITFLTRKFYYDNFSQYMGINYLKYTMYSLLLNILVNNDEKKLFSHYLSEGIKKKLLSKKQIFILIALSIVPSSFLLKIKKRLKQIRKKR